MLQLDPQQVEPSVYHKVVAQENAVGLIRPSADSSPQLVELRESKPFCILDNHDRRVRNVNADFNDSCCDQNIELLRFELAHQFVLFLRWQPAMQQAKPEFREIKITQFFKLDHCGLQINFFRFLNERIHDVRLPSEPNFILHKAVDLLLFFFRSDGRLHRPPILGKLIDH